VAADAQAGRVAAGLFRAAKKSKERISNLQYHSRTILSTWVHVDDNTVPMEFYIPLHHRL